MRLGLGLYKSLLNEENFRFARQVGATDVVVQLVDYVKGGDSPSLARNYLGGWGVTHNRGKTWELDELLRLRSAIEGHGLRWEIIENFDPAHWYDVLLDGPEKDQQLELLKKTIQTVGKAGIRILGYYFSLAGVWGWTSAPDGRGQAVSVGFDKARVPVQQPIPKGMVWNMIYAPEAEPGILKPVPVDELWERFRYFLQTLLPIAEENGIILAAHPDDPPVPVLRNQPRLFSDPVSYGQILEISDSPNNQLEFCMGTIQEMAESDVYSMLEKYASQNRIAYVHFRNVKGKVPRYREVFADEGDIDMLRAMRILHDQGFEGVLIPDHTPEVACKAPWHAGMSFALGYMRGVLQSIEKENARDA